MEMLVWSYFPPLPTVNGFRGPGGMCIIACRRRQPELIRAVSFFTHRRTYFHAQFFLKPLLPLGAINLLIRGTDRALK